MSSLQRTLSGSVTLDGIGVHTGESASVTLRAAPPGSGVVFRRADLEGAPEVPADLERVASTELGTVLRAGDAEVRTVEHLLAALYAHGIDNALVEVDGPEIPIRDGSFADFEGAVREAGIAEQDVEAEIATLSGPVTWGGEGGATYVATPAEDLRVSATIDFEHPSIGRRFGTFACDAEAFAAEIAPARTFGFRADTEALRARGLALGSSLDNTVVLEADGVMNESLRFDDEFLRHKVGDVLGDLALLGRRLHAHVVAERPSHAGNVGLARAIRAHARRAGPPVADIGRIMELLPHRYPMLLVDRVVDVQGDKRLTGIKNVTINEPFFQGHYPGHPIMPGVLVVEAMAQCGGILLMSLIEDADAKVIYFMTMDEVKFRHPVVPGDTLVFHVEVLHFKRGIARMQGHASVDGRLVAEAQLMARIMDK